jgi:hypothetical protein
VGATLTRTSEFGQEEERIENPTDVIFLRIMRKEVTKGWRRKRGIGKGERLLYRKITWRIDRSNS